MCDRAAGCDGGGVILAALHIIYLLIEKGCHAISSIAYSLFFVWSRSSHNTAQRGLRSPGPKKQVLSHKAVNLGA